MSHHKKIDPLLLPIVKKLNDLGLKTAFSCQGNHPRSVPKIAYISFANGTKLPDSVKKEIKNRDWQIDHDQEDGRSQVSVYSVSSDFVFETDELSQKNYDFILGWKSLLGLCD